jgi:tetratricopeptide (TPR) repeat protein
VVRPAGAIEWLPAQHGQGLAGERRLAAAQAKYEAGAFDAALALLAYAKAAPLTELQRAHADLLHAQIAFAANRGGDAPALLLKAARQFEPLDPRLARDTYLDALGAATFAGRMTFGGGIPAVAKAASAAPPPPGPARPHDLLLDGMALLISKGHEAAAPALKQAISAFCDADIAVQEGLRWLRSAWYAASIMWDYESWDVLSARQIRLARDVGALTALPIAFNTRAGVYLLAGRFTEAESMEAEAASVTEVTGSSMAPYGALSLAAFRGREAEVSHLAEITIKDVERRGEGEGLSFVHWARAVLYNALGRYEAALAAAQQAAGYPPSLWFGNWALIELIEAAARGGVPQRADGALQRLSEIARICGTDWVLGIEARCRALVSDGEAAESGYREAIERLDRAGLRIDLARAQLLYGEWLRRQRRRRDARDQLGSAYEAFDSFGAGAFAERARIELRATGGGHPGPHRGCPRPAYRAGSADRPPGEPGRLQPGDRRTAVHQPRDRRISPAESVRQARCHLTRPARTLPPRLGHSAAGYPAGYPLAGHDYRRRWMQSK